MNADNFKFYGQSESETSKMQDIKVYPDVTLTYVAQMDETKSAMIGDYGFLHGFIVYGKAHIYTVDGLNKYVEARVDDGTGPKCAIYYWEDDGTNPDWMMNLHSYVTYLTLKRLQTAQLVLKNSRS